MHSVSNICFFHKCLSIFQLNIVKCYYKGKLFTESDSLFQHSKPFLEELYYRLNKLMKLFCRHFKIALYPIIDSLSKQRTGFGILKPIGNLLRI